MNAAVIWAFVAVLAFSFLDAIVVVLAWAADADANVGTRTTVASVNDAMLRRSLVFMGIRFRFGCLGLAGRTMMNTAGFEEGKGMSFAELRLFLLRRGADGPRATGGRCVWRLMGQPGGRLRG